jgi:hypothetical protein
MKSWFCYCYFCTGNEWDYWEVIASLRRWWSSGDSTIHSIGGQIFWLHKCSPSLWSRPEAQTILSALYNSGWWSVPGKWTQNGADRPTCMLFFSIIRVPNFRSSDRPRRPEVRQDDHIRSLWLSVRRPECDKQHRRNGRDSDRMRS